MKGRPPRMNPVVHKFGGVALSNAAAIQHAVRIVASRPTRGVAVVASAMGGVTDDLLAIADQAKRRDRAAVKRAVAALRERHVAVANELIGFMLSPAYEEAFVPDPEEPA